MIKGYIGSYATSESEAVVQFSYGTDGTIHEMGTFVSCPDSKYLSFEQGDFVTLTKQRDKAGIALLRSGSTNVECALHEDITSCYVTQDKDYIYTANYHEGHVLIYAKNPQLTLYKRIFIKEKAGCHQVLFYEHYMLVPCLFLDTIRIYDTWNDFSFVKEVRFPKGSGPRHGVFDSHNHVYVLTELSNQLFIFTIDAQLHMTLDRVVDLLAEGKVAASAALRMSKEEDFLYISIRDVNEILVYDIHKQCILQRISSGGDHPRDIALAPDEKALFVVNRFSNTLCVFPRNQKDGTLGSIKQEVHVVEGVSIAFEN